MNSWYSGKLVIFTIAHSYRVSEGQVINATLGHNVHSIVVEEFWSTKLPSILLYCSSQTKVLLPYVASLHIGRYSLSSEGYSRGDLLLYT